MYFYIPVGGRQLQLRAPFPRPKDVHLWELPLYCSLLMVVAGDMSRLLLRMRRLYVASIRLDFY